MILYEVLAETGFLLFIDSSSISHDDYDDGGGGDKLFFGMIQGSSLNFASSMAF